MQTKRFVKQERNIIEFTATKSENKCTGQSGENGETKNIFKNVVTFVT